MAKSTRRQFFKAAGAIAAGGVLSACGVTSTPQVVKETVVVEVTPTVAVEVVPTRAPGEKIKLIFEWPQYTPEKARYGEYIINTYMEKNPDVAIEPMYNTDPAMQLTVAIAGGTPPDCGWYGAGWPEFWRRFLELDAFIERDAAEVKYDEFLPKLQGATQWLGKRQVMPMGFTCTLIYFNKDMFNAAGVPLPTDDWTWDDLKAAGAAITNVDQNQWGVVLDWGSEWSEYFYAGPVADEPWKKSLFHSELRVFMIQMWKDLWNKDKIAPPGTVQAEQGPMPMFQTGKLAMFAGGSWALEPFRQVDFDWDIVPNPILKWTDGDKRATGMWTEELFIMDSTKYKEDAWQFVKWASGTELLTWAADQGHVVPGRRPIAESDAFIKTTQKPANIKAFLASADVSIPTVNHPAASKIYKAVGDPVGSFFSPEEPIGADEAAQQADAALQAVLDEWWAKEGSS
jgi:multiple sugar transport system substrate-binding protein